MSNQRNDNSEAAAAIGFMGAAIGITFVLFFALFVFAALVLTVVAFFAWNKPIPFLGSIVTPADARGYVWRGMIGAGLLPLFVVFCAVALQVPVDPDWWPYMLVSGYAIGSLGVDILNAGNNRAEPAATPSVMTIEAELVRPQPQAPRGLPEPPFRFASWDDEEELGR